jgi:plasmid replication initiation protein
MSKSAPRTLDAVASHRENPDAIVQAGEVVEMRFPSGGRMSLRGGKLFHLLIQIAGVKIADDVQHRVTLSSLNETFHVSAKELEELIEELHTTTLKLRLTDAKGRRYTKSGPLLSDVEREEEDDAQAELRYEFSPAMRKVIANSSHWAVISRRAVMAFESRYALRLYTILSLRAGLRKVSEEFTLEDLRELLGVPSGKLARWQDFKVKALDRAVVEVNHLSGLKVTYQPMKRGRRVVGISLAWGVKEGAERIEAIKELDRSRVGRVARREGTVERLLDKDDRDRSALAEDLARLPLIGFDDD